MRHRHLLSSYWLGCKQDCPQVPGLTLEKWKLEPPKPSPALLGSLEGGLAPVSMQMAQGPLLLVSQLFSRASCKFNGVNHWPGVCLRSGEKTSRGPWLGGKANPRHPCWACGCTWAQVTVALHGEYSKHCVTGITCDFCRWTGRDSGPASACGLFLWFFFFLIHVTFQKSARPAERVERDSARAAECGEI